MIDPTKWEQATDEQKLQTCVTVNENVSVRAVTKDDWLLMFKFLLEKVQGGFKVILFDLEPLQTLDFTGFARYRFKGFKVKSTYYRVLNYYILVKKIL